MGDRYHTLKQWVVGFSVHTFLVLTICSSYLPVTIAGAVFVFTVGYTREEWRWIFTTPSTCAQERLSKVCLLLCYVFSRPWLFAYTMCLWIELSLKGAQYEYPSGFAMVVYVLYYSVCRFQAPFYARIARAAYLNGARLQFQGAEELFSPTGYPVGHAA